MIMIDQLPVEMLIKIFSYLPSYDRVSLVSKLFYNVASSVNGSKIIAKFFLTPFYLESPEHQSMMYSIQKTNRKISKVSILLSAGVHGSIEVDRRRHFYKLAISDMVKILTRFSSTIKFLRLECSRSGVLIGFNEFLLEMSDFLEICSLIPNAEHLELDHVFAGTLSQTQVNNECLKLNQLRKLDIRVCDREFLVVFNRLPAGILKEFTFSYVDVDFDVLVGFFTKQPNIKKLTLRDEDGYSERISPILPHRMFDHLKLESLVCYQNEYAGRFAYILSKQIHLKSLDLGSTISVEVDESVLDVITNQLTELVTLKFAFDKTLVESFKKIRNLKKLKKLTINSCSLKIVEAFAGLDHPQITTLNMQQMCTMSDIDDEDDPPMPISVISALANSVPNLKSLQFDYYCECPAIGAILEHFNFVEVLEFNFDVDLDTEHLRETIEVEKSFNPKLDVLIISEYFKWDGSILSKLIAMYPNLKHLHIGSSTKPTPVSSNFALILNGFKKMNSLYLYLNEWKLTAEDLDCIIDRKNNLQWMSLGILKDFTDERLIKLTAVFDVVKYQWNTLTITN